MDSIYIYLIVVNIVGFLLYFIDKRRAIKDKRRISEAMLKFISIIGGSIGSMLSMLIFRHKTKKIEFYLVNILSFILWIIILVKR